MTRYYKSFKPGRIGPYSNKKWPKRIGAWVRVEGELVTVSKPRTITSVDDPGKLWDHVARRDPDKLRLIFRNVTVWAA